MARRRTPGTENLIQTLVQVAMDESMEPGTQAAMRLASLTASLIDQADRGHPLGSLRAVDLRVELFKQVKKAVSRQIRYLDELRKEARAQSRELRSEGAAC